MGNKSRYGLVQSLAISLLVFSGGWFVMQTELVGARVLAPYFGNTIYVWGSVIAIFLLALAMGYAIGGKATEHFASPLIPAGLVAAAGVYVATNHLYQDSLCAWLYHTGVQVKWGALFAATVLYAIPMILCGGVSPYCVQIASRTYLEVGRRAGGLYSISTMGSFIGCLVTAFVLIPNHPLWHITCYGGLIVAWIATVVALALSYKPRSALALIVPLAVVLVVAFLPGKFAKSETPAYAYPPGAETVGRIESSQLQAELAKAQMAAKAEGAKYQSATGKTLFESETAYHRVSVIQEGPSRRLIFGQAGFRNPPQTVVDLRNLNWHVAEYTEMLMAGLLFKPAPKRICVIGVGGGVVTRAVEICCPGAHIDAVDIDPVVLDVARKYFYWRPSKNVRLYAQDGRSFINWALISQRPPYDWIVLDAYNDECVPFHLTTKEFFETLHRVLSQDGVVTANLGIENELYANEARTITRVFGNITAFVGHRSANGILVVQNGRSKPMTRKEASEAAKKLKLPRQAEVDTRFIVSTLREQPNWKSDGPVLSDMWAPVENLIR